MAFKDYQISDKELENYLPKGYKYITAVKFKRAFDTGSYVIRVTLTYDNDTTVESAIIGVWDRSWLQKMIDYFTERGFEWIETT